MALTGGSGFGIFFSFIPGSAKGLASYNRQERTTTYDN